MKMEKPYFFTIDDQPFHSNSSITVTNISHVTYEDLPLLLSMVDSNVTTKVFTVQYLPKSNDLLIYAKNPISLFGWDHQKEIQQAFSNPYQNDFAYSFEELSDVLIATKEEISDAIVHQEKEYEHFLKKNHSAISLLFIRPAENQSFAIATGKADGTAEKKIHSFQQISKDPILFQLLQLYSLKNNYELLQMRKTNYHSIVLGIENNDFFFDVSVQTKTWRIFKKDLKKWISPKEYQDFISNLKIYPLKDSNWLDDALLLKISKQKRRIRSS